MRFIMALMLGLLGSVNGLADDGPAKLSPQAADGDWPWWQGPTRDGISADRSVVTTWGPTENVVWSTQVPGRGHSSPIVCGKRIFLTSADEKTEEQSIRAFDRQTGSSLWSTIAHQGKFLRKHPKNTHASATPACDGERVFSVFLNNDGIQVTATDLDGKILWQTRAGDFRALHGYGSSPVLFKSLVIITGDNVAGAYLTALDARSGKVVWRTERKVVGKYGNYSTPSLAVVGERVQLLQAGLGQTSSYDPETGKLLWSCDGPAEVAGNTVAHSATMVFSSAGFPQKQLIAIRANGEGNVTKSHLAWNVGAGVTYVPSPLYHAGCLFVVNDVGIASCFDAESGKQIWQERLQGAFSSSPVLVGDLLLATNEAGQTTIFKADRTFKLVGTNSLKEPVLATPAVCGGQIFLRTESKLYCLGTSKGK
jgi:outer membrane protein assembly factor BamB